MADTTKELAERLRYLFSMTLDDILDTGAKAADALGRQQAEIEQLKRHLKSMLYYADEWYRHIGSDAMLSDDFKSEIESARAALNGAGHEA